MERGCVGCGTTGGEDGAVGWGRFGRVGGVMLLCHTTFEFG
jgi:hypothetical protein